MPEIQKQENFYKIYQKLCKKFQKEIDIGTMLNRFITERVIVDFCLVNKYETKK